MRRDLVDWARQEGIKPPHSNKFFQADRKNRRQVRDTGSAAKAGAVEAAVTGVEKLAIGDTPPSEKEAVTQDHQTSDKKVTESKDANTEPAEQPTAGKKQKHRRK